MGKDWYYWAGGRSSKRSGGGSETAQQTTPSGCMCAVFQIFDFHPFHFPTTTINNNHSHQQQQNTLNKSSPSSISEDIITKIPRGAEAPRNSLESEDGTASSVTREEEKHFKIPKNIQIKTSGRNLNDLSSSDSPAKTPTLVARLMGLDILPGSNSPSSSSSSCISTPNPQNHVPNFHHHHNMMRPRQPHIIQTKHRNSTDCVEFEATRRSDVDIHHHRLSLQINKENIAGDDLEIFPRFSFSKRKCDENINSVSNRTSSHLAKQIVKQVKESVVSRKVCQDITNNNILKTRDQNHAKELELVNNFKTKKSNSKALIDESSPGKQNSNAYSPKLRFIESNKQNKQNTIPKEQNTLQQPLVSGNTQQQLLSRVFTKPKLQPLLEQKELQNHQEKKPLSPPKCKRVISNEKFSSRLKRAPPQTTDIIRNKQEEAFVVRPTSPTRTINDMKNVTKCKRTHPLSSNLLNNVPNLFPIKTEPSPPAPRINQKQGCDDDTTQVSIGSSQQLTSCSSHRYNNNEDRANDDAASASTAGKFQYISGILSRTTNKEGTTNTTTTSTTTTMSLLSQRFSPLHPSIFDHLEEHPISNSHVSSPNNNKVCIFSMKNQLGRQRWNRRLMFDLVDEMLMDIFRPNIREKKLWYLQGCAYQGTVEGLMEKVWDRIGKLPCKKCEFLEDIDELIETEDMEKLKVEGEEGLEEEGQALVGEIEGNIWDTLLHESVMVMDSCGAHDPKAGTPSFWRVG